MGDVEEESKTEEEGEGDGCSGDYELVMAVGHVKEAWMEVPGNLVAHIRVGPSYHLRKEVSFFILHAVKNCVVKISVVFFNVLFRVRPKCSGTCSMIFTLLH